MPLELNVRRVGDVTLVVCKGRIVAGDEAKILEQRVNELLEFERYLVLHLGEVSFVDSSGLGLLVRLSGMTKARHGALKLCSVSRDVDHTLTITHLKQVLETHASEVEALRAFDEGKKPDAEAGADGRRVLCIDHSANLLALLRGILRQAGYAPTTTNNLHDARLLAMANRPELVVIGPNVAADRVRNIQEVIGATPHVALAAGFDMLEAGEGAELVVRMVKEKLAGLETAGA